MDVIRFENVQKRFGSQTVLRGVSLRVAPGSVHFILGQSGAGKSVLIRHLVGLLRPDAGRVFFFGDDVTQLGERGFDRVRQRCQLIFQNALLFDHLTVLDNVAMPIAKRHRIRRREARQRAHAVLAKVGVESLARQNVTVLGVGVKKRVAIARALALEPEVMLYDEPTTSLDPVAARRTDRLIRDMAQRFGLTSVVVSHDLASVAAIADHVTFLHDGCVGFDGDAASLWTCSEAAVQQFLTCARLR